MNTEYIKNLIMKVDEINRIKEKNKSDGLVSKPRFKIIEKQGCSYCDNAKKLLQEKKIEFELKDQLSPEERQIILNKTKKEYKMNPKIFELKDCGEEYTFLGGFDELEERLNIKK